MERSRWEQYLEGRLVEHEQDDERADAIIVTQILRVYYEEAKAALRRLEATGASLPIDQTKTLLSRWKQIIDLVQRAFASSINLKIQATMHEQMGLLAPLAA